MKILAFAGSNSSKSINHQLVEYVAKQLPEFDTEVIRLTDFNIPMYGIDIENNGFPEGVKLLHSKIRDANGVVISVPEHNGNVTAFFKSIIDWLSRYDREFLKDKKWLLLSTAPGQRGGASSLAITQKTLNYFKGELVGSYSLGNFSKVFTNDDIINDTIKNDIEAVVDKFIYHFKIK